MWTVPPGSREWLIERDHEGFRGAASMWRRSAYYDCWLFVNISLHILVCQEVSTCRFENILSIQPNFFVCRDIPANPESGILFHYRRCDERTKPLSSGRCNNAIAPVLIR